MAKTDWWKKIKQIWEQYQKIVILILVTVVVLLALFALRGRFYYYEQLNFNEGENTALLDAANGAASQVVVVGDGIRSVDLLVENAGQDETVIFLTLTEETTGNVLAEVTAAAAPSAGAEETVHFDLQTEILEENTSVRMTFFAEVEEPQQLSYCIEKKDADETQFRMTVTCQQRKMHTLYFFVIGLLLLAVLAVVALPKKRRTLENMFVILALVGGLAFAILNPPFQECDGWDHFLRSVDASYGNLIGTFVPLIHENGVVFVPDNINDFDYHLVAPNQGAGNELVEHLKEIYFSKEVTELPYQGEVTAFYYWPQALGLLLGRLFHFSVYWCIVLSRIMNLLVYTGVTYFAIRTMPVYRNIFTAIALLPLTLYQAASDSQDALLNALCFVFIALCFSYAYEKKKLTWKQVIWLGVLLAVIFLCKYVYICIGLLVFMIPMKKFGSKKQYFKSFGIACIPLAVLGVGMILQMVLAAEPAGAAADVQQAAGELTQLQYVMNHPLHLVKVIIHTLENNLLSYLQWLSTLGSLNYPIPFLIAVTPAILVGIGWIDTNVTSRQLKRKDKLLCLGAFVITVAALLTALYIGDSRINAVGGSIVQGVQGRYFIAILILAFVALGSPKIEHRIRFFSEKVTVLMGCMNVYAAWILMQMCY